MENQSYKLVLVAALVLAGLIAFFVSRNRVRNSFLLFIAAPGLGYRTLPLTSGLKVHAAEIALLLALLTSAGARPGPGAGSKSRVLPWWVWALLPIANLNWLPAPQNPPVAPNGDEAG